MPPRLPLAVASRIAAANCCAIALVLLAAMPAQARLQLVGRVELPGTQGRLDHLAYSSGTNQLMVAALDANAVEVVAWPGTRRVARIDGFARPQGIAHAPGLRRTFVADGKAGTVQAFQGLLRSALATGLPDADNLRFDAASGRLYVGYGSGLAELDPGSLAVVQRFDLPGHPEAFEVAADRIYVNVPTAGAVVVLDRRTGTVLARWSVAPAAANFPMAHDAARNRLFVATRRPAALRVIDTGAGARVTELAICADADDLFLDRERGHLYAICGDGHVNVVAMRGADEYEVAQELETSRGARTGLLVPELRRLFVAAPARNGRPAAVLVFAID